MAAIARGRLDPDDSLLSGAPEGYQIAAADPSWMHADVLLVLSPVRTDSVADCIVGVVAAASYSSADCIGRFALGKAAVPLDGSACTCYCTDFVVRADFEQLRIGSSACWRRQHSGLPVPVALQRLVVELAVSVCSYLHIFAALAHQVPGTCSSST